MKYRVVVLVIAMAAAATGACKKKSADLAELEQVLSGKAERTEAGKSWQDASAGDRFRAGHAVRTSDQGGARISFTAGGGLRMGPSTIIRFGRGKLAVEGEIAAEQDTIMELEVGRAEISAGTTVRIDRDGDQLSFDVVVGRAVVTRGDEVVEVEAGQGFDVEVGSASVERIRRDPPDAAPPPPEVADAGPIETTTEAEIIASLTGKRARVRTPGGAWTALAPGDHPLAAGTEVRLPRGATLEITRGSEVASVRGAAELVVAPEGAEGALAEARGGEANLTATDRDVAIRVPGGVIVARRPTSGSSRAVVSIDKRKTDVEAVRGTVEVTGERGDTETLIVGQSASILRRGNLEVSARPPERGDFSIDAGLSATIHVPRPPTDVRVRFADHCDGAALLEVSKSRSFSSRSVSKGTGSANVRLGLGSHRYRIRCLKDGEPQKPAVTGSLRVRRNAGRKPLPRVGPHNKVDADGRRYTVLYQNRLPKITFRWPKAPSASSYRLIVKPARGSQLSRKTDSPSFTMENLDEGEYSYWFEAGNKKSKVSSLRIDFDNAASSAYLQKPLPGKPWPAEGVRLSGAAAIDWSVSVGGKPLRLDKQLRFDEMVQPAPDEKGIGVVLRHPSRGVHIYVRRPGN